MTEVVSEPNGAEAKRPARAVRACLGSRYCGKTANGGSTLARCTGFAVRAEQPNRSGSASAERTFRETFGAFNSVEELNAHGAAAYSEALQYAELIDPATTTFVVEHEDMLVAFLQLVRTVAGDGARDGARDAEVRRLYVDTPWHGVGFAQQLMAPAIELAEAFGASRLWLGVWERNARAIAFYCKCGFIESGSHVFMVGADAQRDLIMATRSRRPASPSIIRRRAIGRRTTPRRSIAWGTSSVTWAALARRRRTERIR